MLTSIISSLAVIMTFFTATSVFIHDMHLESAAATLALPASAANYDAINKITNFGDVHTHVERGTLAQAVIDLQSNNPRIQPRIFEDKKHLMQRRAVRGHHAFDNYYLPIV